MGQPCVRAAVYSLPRPDLGRRHLVCEQTKLTGFHLDVWDAAKNKGVGAAPSGSWLFRKLVVPSKAAGVWDVTAVLLLGRYPPGPESSPSPVRCPCPPWVHRNGWPALHGDLGSIRSLMPRVVPRCAHRENGDLRSGSKLVSGCNLTLPLVAACSCAQNLSQKACVLQSYAPSPRASQDNATEYDLHSKKDQ